MNYQSVMHYFWEAGYLPSNLSTILSELELKVSDSDKVIFPRSHWVNISVGSAIHPTHSPT
jgi:hypothetical protein